MQGFLVIGMVCMNSPDAQLKSQTTVRTLNAEPFPRFQIDARC